uniref:uncharacterized protein LOC124049847 n=1 Tax=Scatophagus argus TaxID=75038 RepID=UPI001ED83CE2|nr:uncharacterized protein LOC124049847 [Scatophagus argus]
MISESSYRGEEVSRREVGCQWESPVEEQKEVSYQKGSAERRDAAVQVDLVTQQLSWRHCTGGPGGGALLQHCSTNRTRTLDTGEHMHHLPPLTQTQLPTIPLFGPPAPPALQQPGTSETQHTISMPSMPLCDPPLPPAGVSAPLPPPGLVAPLGPGLAEGDGLRSVKKKEAEQAVRPRRKMVGPPVRYLLESEEGSHGLSVGNPSKVRGAKVKMKLGWLRKEHRVEEEEQSESWPDKMTNHITGRVNFSVRRPDGAVRLKRKMDEKSRHRSHQDGVQSEDRSSVQKVRSQRQRGETDSKTGQAAAQIQHTQAEGGGNKMREAMVKKMLGEEERQKRRRTEGGRMGNEEAKEGGVKPVETEETGQVGRLRRKMVGPPIRYLVESEERSHGLSAAHHSTVRRAKVKSKLEKTRWEHQVEGERRGGVEPTEKTDNNRVKSTGDGGVGKGWQLCQVCGLTFTGQWSLQLHLSVHGAGRGLSCRLCNAKFSCVYTLRLHHRCHHGDADNKQDEDFDAHIRGQRERRGWRSKEGEEKTLVQTVPKAPDWAGCPRRVRRNPWWWFDYRITMRRRQDTERWRRRWGRDGGKREERKTSREEEEGVERIFEKEEERRAAEQPQRPRRKMVGPPIRYLLESEEPSHSLIRANQNRLRGCIRGRKPQKSEAGGGASDDAAMTDSPGDTEQTDRQKGQTVTERQIGKTNWDRANGPKRGGGSPSKVVTDTEAGGGASEMTDRSDAAETQTGLYRQMHLVHIDLQSSQVSVILPCCVRLQRLPLIG